MSEARPSPESLLKRIKKEESKKQGKLKIFFGYAAGVGKTYAMLDAARSEKKAGVDVVLGYIEPHSRPETTALTDGFEAVSAKKVSYRGITLNEFDIDAALKRRPQLILVDELAHTNAEGCRHIKRYDDIEELLDAGIDVYTTLNVQHLESLNDIVASITHISVKERVPDSIFDKATQVQLVDIDPDVLIERLNENKIYKETQAKRALNHFFTRDNLVALREIALRRIADKVTREVESNRRETNNDAYYTREHVLVCLSSSPSNAKVVRAAARFASAFHGSFTALFVETPHTRELTDKNRSRLRENLKLAEQLGAEIATVYGNDIAYQISEYAKASGVSKIVMGRPAKKPGLFFAGQNFVERLISLEPSMDIYIIPVVSAAKRSGPDRPRIKFHLNLPDVLKSIGILVGCTLIGLLFFSFHFMQVNVITIYILGVLIISSNTKGKIYGFASSFLSVLTYNYFFIEPRFTFNTYGPDYPITFLIMLLASLITSSLTTKVRRQARAAAINAHRTSVLLETSRKLQKENELGRIIEQSCLQLTKLVNQPILFFTAADNELQRPKTYGSNSIDSLPPVYQSDEEYAVAVWAFRNGKPAGASTDTLPGAKALYLPVKSNGSVFAVIGIPQQPGKLESFEHSLLDGMINEIALAIEKYDLNIKQNQMKMSAEKERLRANLLRAISHDLRTPLTSISGTANVLLSDGPELKPEEKKGLVKNIYEDSLWLTNLIENILSVTKINDGKLTIQTQPELIQDLIDEALRHIDQHKSEHQIHVALEDDLLMVRVDAHLIVQVIINIVNNAISYTQIGSTISIRAFQKGKLAYVEVADNGNGISDKDKTQIFDMFYTANNGSGDSRRGLGLGLSLCKSIVNAHGGEIYVKDNKPKGTVFGFSLLKEDVKENV